MNTQLNNLLKVISLNTIKEVKVNEASNTIPPQPVKIFTAAELWNIQRRRRATHLFAFN